MCALGIGEVLGGGRDGMNCTDWAYDARPYYAAILSDAYERTIDEADNELLRAKIQVSLATMMGLPCDP